MWVGAIVCVGVDVGSGVDVWVGIGGRAVKSVGSVTAGTMLGDGEACPQAESRIRARLADRRQVAMLVLTAYLPTPAHRSSGYTPRYSGGSNSAIRHMMMSVLRLRDSLRLRRSSGGRWKGSPKLA